MFLSKCQLKEECSGQVSVFTNQNLEIDDFKIPFNLAGEGVEKREHLYTVGGNVNW